MGQTPKKNATKRACTANPRGIRPSLSRCLAGDIVLCSWARQFTLTVFLSTHQGGVEILLVASWYITGDKRQPDGPDGSSRLVADFTLPVSKR